MLNSLGLQLQHDGARDPRFLPRGRPHLFPRRRINNSVSSSGMSRSNVSSAEMDCVGRSAQPCCDRCLGQFIETHTVAAKLIFQCSKLQKFAVRPLSESLTAQPGLRNFNPRLEYVQRAAEAGMCPRPPVDHEEPIRLRQSEAIFARNLFGATRLRRQAQLLTDLLAVGLCHTSRPWQPPVVLGDIEVCLIER